ncbi:MAG: hypothetical protein KBA95_11710 [Acidobacteria bacterium]|nr:hypothetical protein [Acidobacteriota bacterium]
MTKGSAFPRASDSPRCLVPYARPVIPDALISRRGWCRLRQVAGVVPEGLSRAPALIECRLDARSSLADVSFEVAPHLPCLGPLACDVRSRLAMGWLEFDSGTEPGRAPSRFFTPAHVLEPSRPWEVCRSEVLDLLLRIRETAGGRTAANDRFAAAETAIHRLPAGCKVRQIGLMEARSPIGIRLCLSGFENVPGPILVEWLEGAGYRGLAGALGRSRDVLRSLSDHLDLAVDAVDGNGSRAGWEVQLSRRNPRTEERWPRLLAALGLYAPLRPEKERALLNVFGSLRMPGWEDAAEPGACFLVFCINHLKVVFDSHRGSAVKAYLKVASYRKASGTEVA